MFDTLTFIKFPKYSDTVKQAIIGMTLPSLGMMDTSNHYLIVALACSCSPPPEGCLHYHHRTEDQDNMNIR